MALKRGKLQSPEVEAYRSILNEVICLFLDIAYAFIPDSIASRNSA